MTDASPSPSVPVAPPSTTDADLNQIDRNQQVRFRTEGGKLLLLLPPEGEANESNTAFHWTEVWQQLKQRLDAIERFWQPDTTVHLLPDRLWMDDSFKRSPMPLPKRELHLKRVYTSRRQTAVAAATAGYSVEQQSSISHLNQPTQETAQVMAEPLYLETTLRSGADIQHSGTVVILGDVNAGSAVVAEGDILIWGRLRGVAHAGSKGNARCLIMAMQMEPTQLRIADFVARAPETPPAQFQPEVAYVTPQGTIRIARAVDFHRSEKA